MSLFEDPTGISQGGTDHTIGDNPALLALRTGRPLHNVEPPPDFVLTRVADKAFPSVSYDSDLSEFVGEWTDEKRIKFEARVQAPLDEIKKYSRAPTNGWKNIPSALKLAEIYYSPSYCKDNHGINLAISHEKEARRSGEPSYVHSHRVATKYADWCLNHYLQTAEDLFDPQIYIGYNFHDTKEDTPLPSRTLEVYGPTCCRIVNDLTVKVDKRHGEERRCEEQRVVLRGVEKDSLLGRALDALDNAETLLTDRGVHERFHRAQKWIDRKRQTICVVLDEVLSTKGGRPHALKPLLARAREELNYALDQAAIGLKELRS